MRIRSSLLSWCGWAGIAGVSGSALPAWCQAGGSGKGAAPVGASGEIRARWEGPTGLGYREGSDDSYGLWRARLHLNWRAGPWLSGVAELQDARSAGYDKPVPGSVSDGVDVRQAWIRVGGAPESGWALRAGRMPLKLGAGRLVWDPDWSNTGTVFDGFHGTAARGAAHLDLIAAAPVTPLDRRWDQRNRAVVLYGVYSAFRAGGGMQWEPYALFRRIDLASRPAAETHSAYGVRALGSMRGGLRYEVELTGQGGSVAGAPLRAFGLVGTVSAKPLVSPFAPEITATYTHASGDSNAGDRVRRTFQVFYPTTHLRTGATDRLGWSNLRDWLAEGKWKLPAKTALTSGIHLPRLDTVGDAVYSRSGVPILMNPRATSTRLGTELFVLVDREFSKRWLAGIGVAHLFAGPYLRQSGRSSATQPYVFLTCRL